MTVSDTYSLGQEFFRWEIAPAVAGVDPGDQRVPSADVEASKIVTKQPP